MNETLGSQERIRKRKDFLLLYKKGKRYRGKYFNLIYLANDFNFSRMAVIVSKKVGNAVKRNKIKRQMRTLFRRNKESLKKSSDIIIIAKKEILKASWLTLQEDYFSALETIFRNN